MSNKTRIKEYMSKDVDNLYVNSSVEDSLNKIEKTGHDGFPVCDGNKLVGYIRSKDLISANKDKKIGNFMQTDQTVFQPDMSIKTAGRIMFREGISEAPVVDSSGKMAGLITNTDIIRSQIERTTPRKVDYLTEMFSELYDEINIDVNQDHSDIENLRPTQSKVYKDELIGRKYEIKNGLAEPIVVVRTPSYNLIADGHHRTLAAQNLSEVKLKSYVIDIEQDLKIGLAQQSINQGLESVDDMEVIDNEEHPQIEKIKVISEL
jgi:CBS domain-containing protein